MRASRKEASTPPSSVSARTPAAAISQLVTTHELPGAIAELIAARLDRQTFEMAADVFGEQIDRPIALVGLLAQRAQRDRVEIAIEIRVDARSAAAASVSQTSRITSCAESSDVR